MIIAACALLGIGLFAYVFAPVVQVAHGREKSRLEYLLERKSAVYENLRDLNFEHASGKFEEKDYLTMRASLEDEAVTLVAEIETLDPDGRKLQQDGRNGID